MYTLKGYLKSFDYESKKITLLFLQDDTFTINFLSNHANKPGFSPVSKDKTEFYVKYDTKSKVYSDKAELIRVTVNDVLNTIVKLEVAINHYNFKKNDKNIMGWNIKLIKITPV